MSAKILYIEDNPMNMRLVRKMLRMGGYETLFEAETGMRGIEVAEEEVPDIILLDINLPDIDGTEVTATIKGKPRLQHIPIIAVTANAMFGDRERFLDAGCDGYVSKPLSKQTLLDTVGQFVKQVAT